MGASMRIGLVYSGNSRSLTSGIAVQVNAMREFFLARGHEVVLYPVREIRWLGAFPQLVFRIVRPSLGRRFRHWLDVTQPDVVITQGVHLPESRDCARMSDRSWSFVLVQHGFFDQPWVRPFVRLYLTLFGKKILFSADTIVAISHFTYGKVCLYISSLKVVLIPLGINLHVFRPLPDRHAPSFVLGVGRFIFTKNFDTLIRAVHLIPGVSLVLVGGGFQSTTLRMLVRQLGMRRRVRFFRRVRRRTLVRLYNNAAVTVLPSLEEGLGLVLVESLACGTPVIGSRLGGIQDIIDEGKNGFFLENPKDPAELARILQRLLGDEKRRRQMGKEGRKSVERKFDRELLLRQFEKVLQKSIRS